jgi:hypothetical protein
MKKRIRFIKSDGIYQPGDVAGFKNHDRADAYVLRGVAVPADAVKPQFTEEEDKAIEPDDLPPSKRDKKEDKAEEKAEEDASLAPEALNAAIDAYIEEDDMGPLRELGKEYDVGSYHVRGFDSLFKHLLEEVAEDRRDQVDMPE